MKEPNKAKPGMEVRVNPFLYKVYTQSLNHVEAKIYKQMRDIVGVSGRMLIAVLTREGHCVEIMSAEKCGKESQEKD